MNVTRMEAKVSPASGENAERIAMLPLSVNRALGIVASILVGLYGLVFILKPENLYADDSYFYLQVAWNFARGMGSTFNNLMPTNGYHPLWMLVCAAVFKFFPERLLAIHVVAGVIVLLDALMLLTVRRVLLKTGGDLWPIALLLLVPFCFLTQLGSEGSLSGLFLALGMLSAYRLVAKPSETRAFVFSLVEALAVLSRLDNIFIIALLWISVTAVLWKAGRRWLQIATIPVYAVLWGAYLASNRVYFHIWQPISGMLKVNSGVNHSLGSNLPHVALASFALIVVCGIGLALTKRDLFFRTVEVPFAAGIVCHALYISFRMSGETRWTWYYTSWILLASVMLARISFVILEKRRWLAVPVSVLCVILLALMWVRESYQHVYRRPPEANAARQFYEVVEKQAGVHRALAFDQPGRLAYYSNVQIIPLDGLMGDTQFQTDIATMGVEKYMRVNHIDGFIGPAVPLMDSSYKEVCSKIYLSSVQFECAPAPAEPGLFDISGAIVYSRVPAANAGTLRLSDSELVWTARGYVSVWKLKL